MLTVVPAATHGSIRDPVHLVSIGQAGSVVVPRRSYSVDGTVPTVAPIPSMLRYQCCGSMACDLGVSTAEVLLGM